MRRRGVSVAAPGGCRAKEALDAAARVVVCVCEARLDLSLDVFWPWRCFLNFCRPATSEGGDSLVKMDILTAACRSEPRHRPTPKSSEYEYL